MAGERRAARPPGRPPTLRAEAELLAAGHALVAGVDEVGRGALAGPVSVGVVVVDAAPRRVPRGLRDSKLLTPAARTALVPALRRWPVAWAVGHAEADEVDEVGVIAALRRAAWRALALLPRLPGAVLLDGNHDWLSRVRDIGDGGEIGEVGDGATIEGPAVTTRIKADLTCASVAAASVLAKTARDAIMTERATTWPSYDWASNKGYAAPAHRETLASLGPCPQHRRSWRLPGVADPAVGTDPAVVDPAVVDLGCVDDGIDLRQDASGQLRATRGDAVCADGVPYAAVHDG